METVQIRPAVVEEGGEGARGFKAVDLLVSRHLQPVDPVHELPPADDLPDESLHGMQWRLGLRVRRLCGLRALQRIEKAYVEHRGNDRVEHVGLPLNHQVLPGAKIRKSLRDEIRKPSQRLLTRHRECKVGGFARRIRESVHQILGNLPSNRILLRSLKLSENGFGEGRTRLLPIPQSGPVLHVVVPVATGRLAIALHEQPCAAAHLAVKTLHQEALLPMRQFREILL